MPARRYIRTFASNSNVILSDSEGSVNFKSQVSEVCMQQDPVPTEPMITHPKWMRLLAMNNEPPTTLENEANNASRNDVTMQPTHSMKSVSPHSMTYDAKSNRGPDPFHMQLDTDISNQITAHLMQLSGRMPAIRVSKQPRQQNNGSTSNQNDLDAEEGYWPDGIQQTGPFPVVNLYGSEPFGRTQPLSAVTPASPAPAKQQPAWKAVLGSPVAKVTIGLLIGIGLLFLVSRFVDLPTTIRVIQHSLSTPRGIILGLLSGVAFLIAFSIRGMRWKLFLNPIGRVSTFKAIQLFLVGIFLNFLLPIRGGEVAKSLMLKRVADIPISRSLPTVAMDKALDLMPALFIMASVPLLGVQLDIKLWIVLATVGGLLLGLLLFVALAAWKRTAAIRLLHKMTLLLPKAIGSKIEGFATGFVDSLLMGASRPRIFVPAILLTCVAVIFDGLFAMLAFWTIGFPISFGTAIFGYTVYNMFYILPTPPGQVGSNEAVGLLVFSGLLHLPADKVTAMFVFSHPWAALIMCTVGMACLSALGLTISSAMKVQTEGQSALSPQAQEVIA